LSLIPDRSPLADALIALQIVCIPLSKNRQFIGRRVELEILERRIAKAQDCQKSAVVGPRGIGKTQLMLQFAYSVAEHHPETSVFWINAVSAEEFESDTEATARHLRLRSAANRGVDARVLVKRHLSAPSAGKWLLIVDNAHDTGIFERSTRSDGLLQYLPQSLLGVTIFTTRSSSSARRLECGDLLELKEMTRDEAAELLDTLVVDAESLKDRVANANFLAELGHIPLAITQAADYINNPRLSMSDFSRISRSTGFATSSALDNGNQRTQRRPRRNPLPYAYPAAEVSTVNYTPHDTDSLPPSSASGGHLLSLHGAKMLKWLQRIKPCYLMIALLVLAVSSSLAVGMYYSIAQDRMGDGFTTAGWMVAVSTLVLAAPMAMHYQHCRCWGSHKFVTP
jgi:hypothetical protein